MTLDLLYKTLIDLFSKSPRSGTITQREKLSQIILHQILFIQHLRLLWHHDLTLNNFSNLKDFWIVLTYPSLDVAFAQLGYLAYFSILSWILVGWNTFVLIFSAILIQNSKNVPGLMKSLFRISIFLTSKLLFIPITIVMILCTKYSLWQYQYLEEYDDDIESKIIDYGYSGGFFAIISLFLHLGSSILFENSDFDVSHISYRNDLQSKFTSLYDVLFDIATFITTLFYVIMGKNSYIWYLFMCILSFLFICVKYIYYLPYYSFFMNLLRIILCFQIFLVSLIILIGLQMQNGSVILILFAIFQPAMIYVVYNLVKFRVSLIKSSFSSLENIFLYELVLRKDLISGKREVSLLREMNEVYNSNPCKLNLVAQAYYCKEHLNNPMTGLIKISRTSHQGFDIVSNYQVFKCKENLQALAYESVDSFKLYKFSLDLKQAKSHDYLFCKQLLRLSLKIHDDSSELSELKDLVNETFESSKKLNEKYEKLLKIFPDSNTVLELYGTFLSDLLNNQDLGSIYFNKKNDFMKKDQVQRQKNNFEVQKYSCILIISGNIDTIGRIIYADNNFLNFIGISAESIKDSYLYQFIPHPFDINHDIKLDIFIKNATNHHVFRSSPLFMMSFEGFLLECYFNSDCIGCDGQINFLSIIEPIPRKDREAAIISNYGLIQSHTENFPQVIGIKNKFIGGINITDHFSLSIEDITHNFFCIENGIALVVKEKFIGKTNFYSVYVSSNLNTIQKWKNKGAKLQKFEFAEKKLTDLIFFNEEEEKDEKATILVNKVVDIDDKKKNFNSDTSTKARGISPKLLKSSVRALRIMKYLLLASLLTILAYNMIIVIYISQAVFKVNSLDASILLGDIGYTFSQMVLTSRALHLKNFYNLTQLTQTPQELVVMINDLSNHKKKLIQELDSWSFCESSKLFKDENMVNWDRHKVPNYYKSSLYEIIDKLEDQVCFSQANKFLKNLSENKECKDELFYIVYVGIGQPFWKIKEALDGMKQCDMDRVIYLDQIKNWLMIVAISISAVLSGILSAYMIRADRVLNHLWNTFRNRTASSYPEFKRLVYDRLLYYHDYNNHEDEWVKSIKLFKFWHSLRYFKRFLIAFVLTAIIYAVSSYVFYDKIHNSLYHRPQFINYIIIRRILITQYSLMTCEMKVFKTPLTLKAFYPEFDLQKYPYEEFFQTAEEYASAKSVLRKPEIMDLMSDSLRTDIFENLSGVSSFLGLGTYSGYNYLYYESLNLLNEDLSDTLQVGVYLNQVLEMCSVLESLSSKCNKDSKLIIETQLNEFIFFVSSFNLALVLLFIFYYNPYINKEISIVKKMIKLMNYFPDKTTITSCTTIKQKD